MRAHAPRLTAASQAVSRIWRYGQTRPCFVYRLVYGGTMEETLYEATLGKEALFQQVSVLCWPCIRAAQLRARVWA